jgi:hypothetical protein
MVTAVSVTGSESFASGAPRTLLPVRDATDFAVEPGGRCLVISDERETVGQLHVIVNWMSELPGRR